MLLICTYVTSTTYRSALASKEAVVLHHAAVCLLELETELKLYPHRAIASLPGPVQQAMQATAHDGRLEGAGVSDHPTATICTHCTTHTDRTDSSGTVPCFDRTVPCPCVNKSTAQRSGCACAVNRERSSTLGYFAMTMVKLKKYIVATPADCCFHHVPLDRGCRQCGGCGRVGCILGTF